MKRYIKSAKIEADILKDVARAGPSECVKIEDSFHFREGENDHYCIVFEPLGKSLYDMIKLNRYKGEKS